MGRIRFTTPRLGFTLIELSLVMVIIALIIGGVLVGRDLIRLAEIRKQISQFEKWTAAINMFRNKYNCLPGDCANASQFGFGANGDGDGNIGNGFYLGNQESQLAFVHLSLAGLIQGNYSMSSCQPGIGYPASLLSNPGGFIIFSAIHGGQYNGNGSYSYVDGGGIWFRAGYAGTVSNSCYSFNIGGGITPFELQSMDSKMDDGLPFTGSVRLMGQNGTTQPLDIMCNENSYPIYGRNCAYFPTTTCANITVGSNQYANTTAIAGCPYAVRAE